MMHTHGNWTTQNVDAPTHLTCGERQTIWTGCALASFLSRSSPEQACTSRRGMCTLEGTRQPDPASGGCWEREVGLRQHLMTSLRHTLELQAPGKEAYPEVWTLWNARQASRWKRWRRRGRWALEE
eukprot:scaffold2403_cov141-Isochrysis_galbana.AAC.1